MTVPNTLGAIRTKIRRVTGRPSSNQITDTEIDKYINTFYLFDLPEHNRMLPLKQTYTFTTRPNVDTYEFPFNDWMTVEPPFYAAGYTLQLFQGPEQFYNLYPRLQQLEQIATGSGIGGPYTGTVTAVPFLRSTFNSQLIQDPAVLISSVDANGNALSGYDDGVGGFTGNFSGTIDYISGAVSVSAIATTIALAEPIWIQTIPYVASRPQTILFYNNQFRLRPVPDIAYEIQMSAYRVPTSLLLADTNVPLIFQEWWQVIAMGAALKIFEDNSDLTQYANFRPIFDEYLALVQRRSLQQIKVNQASTIYSQNAIGGLGNNFPNA